jgi:hypothetical protein
MLNKTGVLLKRVSVKVDEDQTVEMTAKRYAHLHSSHMKKAVQIIAFEANSSHLAHDHLKMV